MVNPKHLTIIVRKTLHKLGVVEPSIERLIKGTFLIESNLENIFDNENSYNIRRGFMLLPDKHIIHLLDEYLKYRKTDREKVFLATGLQLDGLSTEEILSACESNIAMMVVITYFFYSNRFISVPEDTLESVAHCYFVYFDVDNKHSQEEFIEKYEKTFLK